MEKDDSSLDEDLDDLLDDSVDLTEQDDDVDIEPLEELVDTVDVGEDLEMQWYILKVQVNRENSICDALLRQVKKEGMEQYFGDILVPTEDVREFNKSGKQRIVKRKLFPGYVVVHMHVNEDSWQLVRGTPGIGDFTGAAGQTGSAVRRRDQPDHGNHPARSQTSH